MVVNLAVFIAYFIIITGMHADGRFDGDDAAQLVGRALLYLIGVQIGATILAHIIAAIIHAIATRSEEPDIIDERDRGIELRALRVSFIVFGVGFVVTLGAMAFTSTTMFFAFQYLVAAMTLGDLLGNFTRLRLYRRGF
jgi:hypothetical protein